MFIGFDVLGEVLRPIPPGFVGEDWPSASIFLVLTVFDRAEVFVTG